MSVEKLVEWDLAAENEVLGEHLTLCHFAHHKAHMIWPGVEARATRWEVGYDMANIKVTIYNVPTSYKITSACPARQLVADISLVTLQLP
jgi:hypothetical protein